MLSAYAETELLSTEELAEPALWAIHVVAALSIKTDAETELGSVKVKSRLSAWTVS